MSAKQSDHAGASNNERLPYRLIRGHYSRREGNEVPRRDGETGENLGGKARPFVHYMAKTTVNPDARDEVMLTAAEANALGRRVVPLFPAHLRPVETPADPGAAAAALSVSDLIRIGKEVSNPQALNSFRQLVFRSGHLGGELSTSKRELLAMLRAAEAAPGGSTAASDT